MIKKLLILFLLALPVKAATINAVSCSQTNVQNAINSASSGDTVQVPGGSATWTSLNIPTGILLDGGGCTVTINVENAVIMTMGGTAPPPVFRNFNVTSTNQSVFIDVYGYGPGLITGNTFSGGAASEMLHNMGLGPDTNSGYSDTVVPGSPNQLYVENNTFTCISGCGTYDYGTMAIESFYNARTVFRYNTLVMAEIDQHGTPGVPWVRWFELYNNTFNEMNSSQEENIYITLRGGSGVVFNNHHIGTQGSSGAGFGLWVECGSPGVQCGSGDTYPQSDQVGRGINQNLSPIYFWNNIDDQFGGGPLSMSIGAWSPLAQLNRDFYVSASQPASMKRYQEVGDTSSTTYNYVPYTYPYPLTAGGPNISSLSQTSGTVGTPITITGTGFGASQGGSTVTFNGTLGSPTSWSNTSISVRVPSGATTGNTIVTVSSVASNSIVFTVLPTPPTSLTISLMPN